jgi:hypothetical protein
MLENELCPESPRLNRIVIFLILLLSSSAVFAANTDPYQGSLLIDRYREALAHQQDALRNVSMEVHMEGRIPKLKKQGKMSALRMISSLGKITWSVLGFWGDDTVKKEVMARYMTAEVEAANSSKVKESQNIAITPENYEFKYKGLNDRNSRQVHIFELKPRHKRVGLFKGELWLDPETSLPVRETGRLVKNPSVFVKKMEFTRDYEIKDGVAYLKRMISKTETRIVGRAELSIEYANFAKQPAEPSADPVSDLRPQ